MRVEELSLRVRLEKPFNPFIVQLRRVARVLEEETQSRPARIGFRNQGPTADCRSSRIRWWMVRVWSIWSGWVGSASCLDSPTFGLKCIFICYINHSMRLSKVFISLTSDIRVYDGMGQKW